MGDHSLEAESMTLAAAQNILKMDDREIESILREYPELIQALQIVHSELANDMELLDQALQRIGELTPLNNRLLN